MSVLGVDACKGGWVAVEWFDDGTFCAHFLPTIDAAAKQAPGAEVIAIDIPIGLPDSGRREADVEASQALGARRSSVFMTPPRAALMAETHAEGTALAKAATGSGMSQQAFALRAKIFEVDAWLSAAPCPVVEVHPEVSFATLLGRPASAPKKTWQGMVERYRALTGAGLFLDEATGEGPLRASVDDMLDAGVAAWSARRVLAGQAYSLPSAPHTVGGRPMAIWV